MVEQQRTVYGGVDTHKDFHVAAVIDATGRILGTETFATTTSGYQSLVRWLRRHGEVVRIGIEGTGAYGAGLCRHVVAEDIEVVEVNRPNRQMRRRRGKNDTVDAEAAARAALNGDAAGVPKDSTGIVESIRVLRLAFCSTRVARVRIANQIRDLVLTATDDLRRTLNPLETAERVEICSRMRPSGDLADPDLATKTALRTLARQYQALSSDLDDLRAALDDLTTRANPALCAAMGIGSDVASILLIAAGQNADRLHSDAAFAALCGASPIETSSGKHTGHRLNRGGNRQANHALWRIVMVRLTCHQPTKDYAARRRAEGKNPRFIARCLKRYVAREVFHHLTHPEPVPSGKDLRAARLAAGYTQDQVADPWQSRSTHQQHREQPRLPPPTHQPLPLLAGHHPADLQDIGASSEVAPREAPVHHRTKESTKGLVMPEERCRLAGG
jgi:transposase